jgi:hypothetical protein
MGKKRAGERRRTLDILLNFSAKLRHEFEQHKNKSSIKGERQQV